MCLRVGEAQCAVRLATSHQAPSGNLWPESRRSIVKIVNVAAYTMRTVAGQKRHAGPCNQNPLNFVRVCRFVMNCGGAHLA